MPTRPSRPPRLRPRATTSSATTQRPVLREVLVPASRLHLPAGRPDSTSTTTLGRPTVVAAGFHQHAQGLARQHARRLLGAGPRARRAASRSSAATRRRPRCCSPSSRPTRLGSRTCAPTTSTSKDLTTAGSRDSRAMARERRSTARRTGCTRRSSRFATRSAGVPTGGAIAYWQFDTTGVEMFTLINDTDTLYPTLTRIPYPKAGTTNRAVRVGVVRRDGGPTTWMQVPGDPRDTLPRAALDGSTPARSRSSSSIACRTATICCSATRARAGATGLPRRVDDMGGRADEEIPLARRRHAFLWVSERDGWRHAVPRPA